MERVGLLFVNSPVKKRDLLQSLVEIVKRKSPDDKILICTKAASATFSSDNVYSYCYNEMPPALLKDSEKICSHFFLEASEDLPRYALAEPEQGVMTLLIANRFSTPQELFATAKFLNPKGSKLEQFQRLRSISRQMGASFGAPPMNVRSIPDLPEQFSHGDAIFEMLDQTSLTPRYIKRLFVLQYNNLLKAEEEVFSFSETRGPGKISETQIYLVHDMTSEEIKSRTEQKILVQLLSAGPRSALVDLYNSLFGTNLLVGDYFSIFPKALEEFH